MGSLLKLAPLPGSLFPLHLNNSFRSQNSSLSSSGKGSLIMSFSLIRGSHVIKYLVFTTLVKVAILPLFFDGFINFLLSHEIVNSIGMGSRSAAAHHLILSTYHSAWPTVSPK